MGRSRRRVGGGSSGEGAAGDRHIYVLFARKKKFRQGGENSFYISHPEAECSLPCCFTALCCAPRVSAQAPPPRAADSFASQELARTWERTGKGKRCWQPGDATGDTRDDARLLFTSWRLTPLRLRTRPGCLDCVRCQLVLSHIGLPFRCEAAEGEFAPALFGAGVGISDNAGIAGVEEICEFAEANGAAMAG